MATSIVHRDDPGTKWYLSVLSYTPSNSWGALNTGSNYAQSKQFTFSKEVSWQSSLIMYACVQTDGVFANIVPMSNTSAKVTTLNVRNATIAAAIVRVYILCTDPTVTVSWA